jgi:hypothetical protein
MTTAEVATTMQEEAETGRPFAELAVEHGRIDANDIARLTEPDEAPVPAASVPASSPVPEFALDATPAPAIRTPQPEPTSPPEPLVRISLEPALKAPAEPEPAVKPPAEPEPAVSAPAVRSQVKATVFLRLTSGERISAGEFDGQDAAERRAKELMIAIDAHGNWPSVGGRYIKPDAVVSIDVDLPAL